VHFPTHSLQYFPGWDHRSKVLALVGEVQTMKWFLAGLGIGTVIGMMIAPASGDETREILSDAAEAAVEVAQGRIEEVTESVYDKVQQSKKTVESDAPSDIAAISNLHSEAS
jgi:gas vesicle protein